MRATVAWSYELLSERERLLFDRISVFAGSFDLAAVESVFAVVDVDADDPVDLLGSLVDKSMLATDRSAGILRYRLLEPCANTARNVSMTATKRP